MATLNVYTAVEFTVGTQTYTLGSKTTPVTFTYTNGLVANRTISLATGAKNVLLTAIGAGADINTLDAFLITSDKQVYIQLEGSSAANNSTFILEANQYVFISHGDIITYGAAGNFASTTPVDITTIRADNESGSTAVIRIWAFG